MYRSYRHLYSHLSHLQRQLVVRTQLPVELLQDRLHLRMHRSDALAPQERQVTWQLEAHSLEAVLRRHSPT